MPSWMTWLLVAVLAWVLVAVALSLLVARFFKIALANASWFRPMTTSAVGVSGYMMPTMS